MKNLIAILCIGALSIAVTYGCCCSEDGKCDCKPGKCPCKDCPCKK